MNTNYLFEEEELNKLRNLGFLEVSDKNNKEVTDLVYYNKHLNLKIYFKVNLKDKIVNLNESVSNPESLDIYKKCVSDFNSNFNYTDLTDLIEYFKK